MGFHKGVAKEHFVLTLQVPVSALCNCEVFDDAFNELTRLTSLKQSCLSFCQLDQISGVKVQHVLIPEVLRGSD